jgi:hypothetical protein
VKSRRILTLGTTISLAIAASASACSSSNSGTQTTSTADSSIGASAGASASATDTGGSTVILPPGSGGTAGSGNGSSTTSPSTKHTSSPKSGTGTTPSPTPTVQPQLLSVNYQTPGCTTTSGTSTVVLSWTTKDGTSVYLSESSVAFPFDPKSSGGAIGPLPPNGSKTVPYDCANDYDYYMVGVYNSIGKQYESEQIPNPAN